MFKDDIYWNSLCLLPDRRLALVESEIFDRMFHAILLSRVCSHIWFCSRSQEDLHICQYCTLLWIQNDKINSYMRKKFLIQTRLFPMCIINTILHAPEVRFFVSVITARDRQKPFSHNNFGAFFYEEVSSAFVLFKFYLDVIGRIIFNLCAKKLLPIILDKRFYHKKYELKKKVEDYTYFAVVKLIKRLVVSTCQEADPQNFIRAYETYQRGVHLLNPYLSIDRKSKQIENE